MDTIELHSHIIDLCSEHGISVSFCADANYFGIILTRGVVSVSYKWTHGVTLIMKYNLIEYEILDMIALLIGKRKA